MKTSVGIIGVRGYAGQELLKILLGHRGVSIQYLGSRSIQKPSPLGKVLPAFRNLHFTLQPLKLKEAQRLCDLIFLALPHGTSMEVVSELLKKPTMKIVDLSADFRLRSASAFFLAYHLRHRYPKLLKESVYGLPEFYREKIQGARLVANPGCYPTGTLLGLLPLAAEGLLSPEGLIVDAKSGVTGAGRSLKEELLFSEVHEDLRAYRVNTHQHAPEMEQELSKASGRSVRILFVPHLVPMRRGIYATIYAPLTRKMSVAQLRSVYRKKYQEEPFIRLLPEGTWPDVKSVEGTNWCDVGLTMDRTGKRAIILVAIDNLGKGAAAQAVQNMNLLCDFPETEGLLPQNEASG